MNIISILSSPARVTGLLALASSVALHAAPVETDSSSSLTNWSTNTQIGAISNSDLLESGSSTFSSLTANNPASTNIVSTYNTGLNDGMAIGNGNVFANSAYYAYNDPANGGAAKGSLIVGNQLGGGGEVLTFNLNTVTSPYGYNINTINTIAGWTDHASVSNQNYTLQYSLVGTSGVFHSLTSVAYNPNDPTADNPGGGGVATEVSLTSVGLANVAALRFTFTADPSSLGYGNSATGIWVQEIDAFGTASVAAVPEPSTWAMMLLGVSGLAFIGFRRKSNS